MTTSVFSSQPFESWQDPGQVSSQRLPLCRHGFFTDKSNGSNYPIQRELHAENPNEMRCKRKTAGFHPTTSTGDARDAPARSLCKTLHS